MLLAGAAASTALDILSSLKDLAFPSGPADRKATGTKPAFGLDELGPGDPPGTDPALGGGTISADTMRALLAMQSQPGAPITPFARLDRDGNGRIARSEFDDVVAKLGDKAGRQMRFDALDRDGSGDVDENELAAALRGGRPAKKDGVNPAYANALDLFRRMQSQSSEMLANTVTGKALAVTA